MNMANVIKNEKVTNFRKDLAESFIKGLERDGLSWKQGWADHGLMRNATTEKPYRGINQFKLQLVSYFNDYNDPRWMTFKQIQNGDGLKLLKGSKGTQIEYWFPYDDVNRKSVTYKEMKDLIDDGQRTESDFRIFPKYFTVFNGSCIEGLPELTKNNLDIEPSEIIETLSVSMGVPIVNDGGDNALYRRSSDSIHLPDVTSFYSSQEYNATALHELAHSTGHETRLNREFGAFGTRAYAREELVAEITSAFMMPNTGIMAEDMNKENHQAYINSWIEFIKDEPEALIKAIKEAEKATNYMEYSLEKAAECQLVIDTSKNKKQEIEL